MRTAILACLCVVFAAGCATDKAKPQTEEAAQTAAPAATPIANTKDPVCGMNITAADAAARADHAGKTYGFCSGECADEFRKAPEGFMAKMN